jgi:hypothetical protein
MIASTVHRSSVLGHAGVEQAGLAVLNVQEFKRFSDLIFRIAGISMSPAKKPLISSRLAKRLKHHQLASYDEYFRFITSAQGKEELQEAVDSLTTNETHFFREPPVVVGASLPLSAARNGENHMDQEVKPHEPVVHLSHQLGRIARSRRHGQGRHARA